MKNHQLIGTGIGITTHKGAFAALILKLRTADRKETLTLWGRQSIVELLHVLAQYLSTEKKGEPTDADNTSFEQSSPALIKAEYTAPGQKSVVRNITTKTVDGLLELGIFFHHDDSSIEVLVDDITAQILIGFTCNALLEVKELESVLDEVSNFCYRQPLVIFDCTVNTLGEINYIERGDFDIKQYRSLHYLYGVALMLQDDTQKHVAGGFFVKSPIPNSHPHFDNILLDATSALENLASLDKNKISFAMALVHTPDGNPPDVDYMNYHITQMHLHFGRSGTA